MPIMVRNIAVDPPESQDVLLAGVARRLKLPADAIRVWSIVRRSIDARGGQVKQVYNIELALDSIRTERHIVQRLHREDVCLLIPPSEPRVIIGTEPMPDRPIVIGFGPAGMFAALWLARHGYRPIVIERGQPVRQRHVDVLKRFWRERDFDSESNLLFGEGGAGCYSDGKLRTRLNDPRITQVLQALYEHGATPDILIDSRPHIGSDRLPSVCRRIRQTIEALGGHVRFGCRVDRFGLSEGVLTALICSDTSAVEVPGGTPVLLGIGHSARDTFRSLMASGVRVEVKPFQAGVRIEHPQEWIDRWQYGACAGQACLPPADYQLVARGAGGPRGDVFSFCMCPGGQIVPCNESAGLVAVNGASRSRRAGLLGNSGLVVTLGPADVGEDPLAAMLTLEQWERSAFEVGGGDYAVPVQRASDFLADRSSDGTMSVSYPLGGRWGSIRSVLPPAVSDALAAALRILDRRMPGFAAAEALMAAPETRASCPLRIVRDAQTRASVSASNLYPIGEGAGYAGGIISAAVDGIRTTEGIMQRYCPPR